jgi:hypothetical protein
MMLPDSRISSIPSWHPTTTLVFLETEALIFVGFSCEIVEANEKIIHQKHAFVQAIH